MIKGKDIVILSIQPWDIEIGSNCKNIALEFAKENRVLYVNPPMDRITRLKQKNSKKIQKRIRIAKGEEADIVNIGDNLWNLYPKDTIESINWINSQSIFNALNKRNSKILSKNIASAIERLGFSDFLLFNDSSMFLGLHLKELLEPQLYTYYIRDYLVKVPYWKKHGELIEPKLIAKADVVLNNSTLYAEYGSQFNKNSIMVGQGCDIEMFTDEENQIIVPEEFNNIPSPVIGYVGSLTTLRLDIDLLVHIAKQKPEWSVVLVGPEDEKFKNCALHQMPNVYFLGSKDSKELPSYIKGFDICTNPQIVNDITIGNYPRKIDEYLAMGKPVVATDTKAMEMFNQHVYLGKTKEDYVKLIELALAEHSNSKSNQRIAFAKSHTWENNVKDIYNAITTSTQKLLWN
ncbi:glycosyltransferase [Litoribaculum gwangyangense]|uniref:Glycosyltransferase family 1 protein n=1 Tax=Litoribaculum gwangyangense TaxID=1130722 RepID=A0ABP9CJ68_9FLAO